MAKITDAQVMSVLQGVRSLRPVVYPGTEGGTEVKVAVRVLSDEEIDLCRDQAQAMLRTKAAQRGWDPVAVTDIDPDSFERLVQRQIVWRAFYDVDTVAKDRPEQFFPTYVDVAQRPAAEVQRLFQLYLEHQAFVAPLRSADEEQVKEIVDALGKGLGSPAVLDGFERSTLVSLCISMARALRSK